MGIFTPKKETIKANILSNCIDSNQIWHNNIDHQILITHHGWSKCVSNKFKMADGRHIRKIETLLYFRNVGPIFAKFSTMMHFDTLHAAVC